MTIEDDDLDLTPTGIDPDPSLSISALLKRWDISKPTLYGYFKTLSITPVRQGRAAYIAGEQRELVSALVYQLRQSKNVSIEDAVRGMRAMGIYVPPTTVEPDSEMAVSKTRAMVNKRRDDLTADDLTPDDLTVNDLTVNDLTVGTVARNIGSQRVSGLISKFWEISIDKLSPFLSPFFAGLKQPVDPLADCELIERLCQKGWELPTSRLAEILNLSPNTIGSMNEFDRLGFHFKKVGKTGREVSWSVTKIIR